VSGVPVLPVAECGESSERRQKVCGDGERYYKSESARIAALRIFDFLGDGRELLVAGVEPQAQSQSDAENFERRLARNNNREERIVLPLRQADCDHCHYRQEDEDLKRGGDLSDHLDAAHVDPGDDRDQRQRDQVVLPADDLGKIVR